MRWSICPGMYYDLSRKWASACGWWINKFKIVSISVHMTGEASAFRLESKHGPPIDFMLPQHLLSCGMCIVHRCGYMVDAMLQLFIFRQWMRCGSRGLGGEGTGQWGLRVRGVGAKSRVRGRGGAERQGRRRRHWTVSYLTVSVMRYAFCLWGRSEVSAFQNYRPAAGVHWGGPVVIGQRVVQDQTETLPENVFIYLWSVAAPSEFRPRINRQSLNCRWYI